MNNNLLASYFKKHQFQILTGMSNILKQADNEDQKRFFYTLEVEQKVQISYLYPLRYFLKFCSIQFIELCYASASYFNRQKVSPLE